MERFERKITFVDVFIISLAFVSLGLLVYEDVYDPTPEVREFIVAADLVIVGVFALEFVVRVVQAERKWNYVQRHWYDLIGMVPVSYPLFRAFRLARLVRIVAIASRFLRAADRSLGEAFVQRQFSRYRDLVVEELTDPLVLAVLGVTEHALAKGNYASAVARALRKNREVLAGHITEQMHRDPALNLLLKAPGLGAGIERLPGRVLDGVAETLDTPDMDRALRSILLEVIGDLRTEIAAKDWKKSRASPTA